MEPEIGIDVQLAIDALRAADLMPPVIGLHLQGDPGRDSEVLVIQALGAANEEARVGASISRTLGSVPHQIEFWNGAGPRPGASYVAPD